MGQCLFGSASHSSSKTGRVLPPAVVLPAMACPKNSVWRLGYTANQKRLDDPNRTFLGSQTR
jgi:hypothetical protein